MDHCQCAPVFSIRTIFEINCKLFLVDSNVEICPLYAGLPSALQMNALRPTQGDVRKIVLATNIAETSITIPGVKYVIDTGFVKAKGMHIYCYVSYEVGMQSGYIFSFWSEHAPPPPYFLFKIKFVTVVV